MTPEPPLPEEYWTPGRLFRLSAFWFALSFHWAVLLSIVLQRQVELFAPEALQGTYFGILAGSGALASAFVQIVVGHRSDHTGGRWGRRRPYMLAGTLLALGGIGLMAAATDLLTAGIAFLLIQLTTNIANGPYQALLPDLVPRARHGVASTWMGLMRNLGEAAGPLVAGYLLAAHVPTIMAVDAVLMVGLMLVTVLGTREPPYRPAPGVASPPFWDAFRVPLKGYPDFLRLLASRSVINLGFYTALAFFYFYVHHSLGVEDYKEKTGLLLFVIVLSGLLGALPAGPLGDRFSKVRLIYVANTLTVGAALWFVLAPSYGWAAGAGVFLGLGFGAFTVLDWALAFSLLPPGGSARYMGIWNLTSVIPMILAPAIAGPATDLLRAHVGAPVAYRVAMATVVVYLAVGTLLLRGVREEPPGGDLPDPVESGPDRIDEGRGERGRIDDGMQEPR